MKELKCSMPGLHVQLPKGLSSQLVFRVYQGISPIAYAQLSRGTERSRARHPATSQFENQLPSVSYCLRNIEVLQNYRHYGIGSALLDEVIDYCRSHDVASIYGEAKGDVIALKKWYHGRGFSVTADDDIQLLL